MNTPNLGTEANPFISSQVVLQDESGRLFFNRNSSIQQGVTKLTLFGGQQDIGDNRNSKLTASRELAEIDETGLHFAPGDFIHVCDDGPKKFNKGWFLANIYFLLVSKNTGDAIENSQVFNSLEHFEGEGPTHDWGTSFEHTKDLVHKAIALGK